MEQNKKIEVETIENKIKGKNTEITTGQIN